MGISARALLRDLGEFSVHEPILPGQPQIRTAGWSRIRRQRIASAMYMQFGFFADIDAPRAMRVLAMIAAPLSLACPNALWDLASQPSW